MTTRPFLLVVVAAPLAACFGSGPTPSKPTQAVVVFGVSQDNGGQCGELQNFIDDAAFVNGMGVAAVAPVAIGGNCDNGGGGGSNTQPAGGNIYSFPLDGTNPQGAMFATLDNLPGDGTSFPPRIAVAPVFSAVVEPTWVWEPTSTGTLQIASMSLPKPVNLDASLTGGENALIAFVSVGSGAVLGFGNAGTNGPSADPSTPAYPCCNEGGIQDAVAGQMGPILPPTGSGTSSPTWTGIGNDDFDLLRWTEVEPIVADGSGNLYYVSNQPALAEVGSGSAIAPFDPALNEAQQTGIVFVAGIGTGSPDQVWSSFTPIPVQTDTASPAGCSILSTDLDGGTTSSVLMTGRFSCWDLQTDGTFVYFAIVSIDCGDCVGGAMRGIGIGRVAIGASPSTTFESLATGVTELGFGPRRVFPQHDGSVLTADPFSIAKIDPGALAGHHDFAL